MLDFGVIKEINKKAIESIKSDSDGESIQGIWKKTVFYGLFYAFPIALSILSWYKNIEISNLEGYIATGIAIFTGLFFSLLLSIGAKVRAEKANKDIDQDNFQSFKTSMKQIANITLYVIILGVFIFLLILLNNILKSESYVYIEQVFTAVILFLLGRFIVSLFFMVQRLFFLVRDELDNIL